MLTWKISVYNYHSYYLTLNLHARASRPEGFPLTPILELRPLPPHNRSLQLSETNISMYITALKLKWNKKHALYLVDESALRRPTAFHSDAACKDHLSGPIDLELGPRSQNVPDLLHRFFAICLLIVIERVKELKELLPRVSRVQSIGTLA